MPDEAAAAWGALSSLTSLEVDTMLSLAPAVKQLPNLVELSAADFTMSRGTISSMISALPQLQVLRYLAFKPCSGRYSNEYLNGFSSTKLQQVDGMSLDPANLSHPLAISKCYPTMRIVISSRNRAGDIADWVQRGGGKQVTKLLICSDEHRLMGRPSISHWPGIPALRNLELYHLDLSPGLQQLRGLTQLTHLQLDNCSPDLHSLDQLPPGLCSLSLDNLRGDAALQEQHQQAVPQLPHLTKLVIKGDRAVTSSGRVVTALLNLQQLTLDPNEEFSPGSTLATLSHLTSLSSLIIPYLGRGNKLLEGVNVLAMIPCLQQVEVTRQYFNPLLGLEIAAKLGNHTAIKLDMRDCRSWGISINYGGMLQVSFMKAC
jgi:hypothetical protein